MVAKWVGGLPGTMKLLWQLTQVAEVWLCWNRITVQFLTLWQVSQAELVGMCLFGLPGAMRLSWHPEQVRGADLKTPPMWQLSHATFRWPSVRGKPVRK